MTLRNRFSIKGRMGTKDIFVQIYANIDIISKCGPYINSEKHDVSVS